MSYTYTASDGTKQPLTNIISTYNIVNQDTASSVTNLYGGFPTVANNIINNSYFDSSIGPIGYLDLGIDIGNEMPVAVDLYTATRIRNDLTINRSSQNAANTVNLQFNSTYNTNVTFPNYINHISIVMCGGGGGGGGSNSSSNGGFSGTGGGGGGWHAMTRLDLNKSGRNFNIQAGEEGHCGVAADYAVGNNGLSAGGGDESHIITQNGQYMSAWPGNAGAYADLNGGTGGGYGSTINVNDYVTRNGGVGNDGGRGGTADSNRATCGGSAGYNFNNNSYNNSLIVTNKVANNNVNYIGGEGTPNNTANGPVNNCPGEPGGGNLENVSNTTNGDPGFFFGWSNGETIRYKNPSPDTNEFIIYQRFGGGGGGASGNNNNRVGCNGGCGAPGFVLIFKYRA